MREATATSVSPGFSVPGHPDRDNQSRLALGDIHQEAFSFGVLYPVSQLASFVIIADRLGEGNARLDQHECAHCEIALHREVAALIEGATFLAILGGTIAGGIAMKGGGDPLALAVAMMLFAVLCWGASLFIPRTA